MNLHRKSLHFLKLVVTPKRNLRKHYTLRICNFDAKLYIPHGYIVVHKSQPLISIASF